MAPYALKNRKSYFVGAIAFEEEELQLVMAILANLHNGEERILRVLVDTGAQANLVRTGLMPDCIMREAKEKLNLRTANGQKLAGGEREVDLSLGFRQVIQGDTMPELLWENATFVEADIRVDAILSFPWLVKTKIGVFPHLRALALAEPEMTLLMGLPKVKKYRVSKVERKKCEFSK